VLSCLEFITEKNAVIITIMALAVVNMIYFTVLNREILWQRIGTKWICLVQIITDIIGILVLVHFTGGLTNPFVFFVAAPVIVAGIFFQPWWTYVLAFSAWGLTALLGLLEANGVLAHHRLFLFSNPSDEGALHSLRSATLVTLGLLLFASAYLVCKVVGALRKREWHLANLKTSVLALRKGQAEEADMKRAALAGFASGISREVKDPLGIIRARVDSMKYDLEDLGQEDGTLFDDLKIIAEKVNHMDRTVDKIIRFMSHSTSEKETIDVGEVLSFVAGEFLTRPENQAITLVTRIGDLPRIEGSRPELMMLFMAVLQNAQEALHDVEGSKISLSARKLSGAEGPIVVRIRDNGRGIPPGIQHKIFDPFFSTRGGDRGMGLALAYTIVQNHSGELRVRSRPPPGTSVTVLLPLREPVPNQ
jgi:signal transduction histidine kinase